MSKKIDMKKSETYNFHRRKKRNGKGGRGMLKVFRYFNKIKWHVAAILLLLGLQAWCDLSLPQYTSDIVDVGIQQGGIENAAMKTISTDTLEKLELFLTEEERETVQNAYRQEGESCTLTVKDKKQVEELNQILGLPMVILQQIEEKQGMDADTLRGMLADGRITQEDLSGMEEKIRQELGPDSERIIHQMALLFVQEEYERMGVDLHSLQMRYLLTTGSRMLGIALLMACAAVVVGLLASQAAATVGKNLRGSVFRKVVSFSSPEIDRFSTASLITRTTNDIQQIQTVTVMILRVVLYAPIIGIGGILKVSGTKTGMGWIIGLAVGTALAVVAVLMSAAMPRFKKMQKLVDRLNLVSREILTGESVIRAFSREKHEEERFDVANRDLMKTQLFTNRVMNFMMPVMMFLMGGVSVLIVWNGGHGINEGTMQVGDMIAFITYTMQIVMAFLMIAMVAIMLPRAGVAAARIQEVLDTQPVICDPEKPEDEAQKEWKGEICFDDVSFHYADAKANVLEHISFTAKPGETTAIIGSTGSGKSTLLNLIPRFFDVTEGRITIDGVDIRKLSQHKLHSLMGYVPQKGILFSGDIRSNLKFGGEDITEEDMKEAASIAQAEEFILEKTERYDSPVSQGGTNVSGGQKQRLSIARAIARHPKIFLFDDSFSALDYKTDVALRRALNEKIKDAAVLIVAQRISTILHADQILVLEEGKIVGAGTHEELMRTCPTYQEIAGSQLSETELGGVRA